MKRLLTLSALSALFACSCLVGPDYKGVQNVDLPVTWVNALPPASNEASLTQWWKAFGDPQLDGLIATALRNNPDQITAMLTILNAESNLRSMRSRLLPVGSVSFGGRNSGSFNTSTSHGSWDGSLSASWSPDVWGGTRRSIESAVAMLHSDYAAAAASRVALASSVAGTYFDWISAKESLRVAEEQLVFQERTHRRTQVRAQNGLDAGLALEQSSATIAETRARIPGLKAQISICENTLATYLGTTVDKISLTMPSPAVYNRIPRVPTGLPSDLLRRRPDIIRAEYDLHADVANIGVQVAALFPNISLTGSTSAGAGSDFADFFRSAGWSLVGSLGTTIFNRTALNENVTQAKLSSYASAQAYRKTVLEAFAEVEECLIDYARLTNQLPQYVEAARANKRAAEISERLHQTGNTDFLNVATAERAWLSSELNIISTRQQIRKTLAKLCSALGGGWDDRRILDEKREIRKTNYPTSAE